MANPVRQRSVFEHLQQNIEDVRMSLLDFIQQDDGVRRPADALGQLTAFFVAHIPRRRADELRDGVLFHELRHVETNQRFLRPKQKLGQAARDFRFSNAGGPQEKEASHGPHGRLESGAAAANGASERGDGLVLTNDALVQFRLDAQQLLLLVFLDGSDSNAGRARPPRQSGRWLCPEGSGREYSGWKGRRNSAALRLYS